jgi:hypothetical protein
MSTLEDQVRAALREIAEEAQSAPLLQRLEASQRKPEPVIRRQGLLVGAVAAAVVLALVWGVVQAVDRRQSLDPIQQPPKILRLSSDEDGSLSPGRALMAVSLAADGDNDNTPAYVLPSTEGTAVLVPGGFQPEGSWTQHLSADGTRFVRQSWEAFTPRLEIVDLRTGDIENIGQDIGHCPQLSPDNSRIAAQTGDLRRLVIIERRSGKKTRLGSAEFECGYNTVGRGARRDVRTHHHQRIHVVVTGRRKPADV